MPLVARDETSNKTVRSVFVSTFLIMCTSSSSSSTTKKTTPSTAGSHQQPSQRGRGGVAQLQRGHCRRILATIEVRLPRFRWSVVDPRRRRSHLHILHGFGVRTRISRGDPWGRSTYITWNISYLTTRSASWILHPRDCWEWHRRDRILKIAKVDTKKSCESSRHRSHLWEYI